MADDATMNESQRQTLKTARCLRVPVLDEDEAIIKSNAKAVGLWLTGKTKFRVFTRARDVRSSVLALLQELGKSQKKLQSVMQQVVMASGRK